MRKLQKVVVAIALVLIVLSSVVYQIRGVMGFNYKIYNYFSGLYFQGINPYNAPAVPEEDPRDAFKRPTYLDYSGLQLSVYNLCYMVRHRVWSGLDGFVLYSTALWSAAVLAAYHLRKRAGISAGQFFWFMAFLLAPYVWYRFFIFQYEDKALYLLLPPLILVMQRSAPILLGAIMGLFTGLVGVPALVLPVLILSYTRRASSRKQKARDLAKFAVGFTAVLGVSMVPFFPESLEGWVRRSNLESKHPFWFSGWRLLGDLYFPGLNKIAVVVCSVLVYVLYGMRRLTLNASVVVLLSFPFFFSVTMGAQRILPAVVTFPLGLSTKRGLTAYAIAAYALLFLFLWLDETHSTFLEYPHQHALAKSALLLLPCALGYAIMCAEAITKWMGSNNRVEGHA